MAEALPTGQEAQTVAESAPVRREKLPGEQSTHPATEPTPSSSLKVPCGHSLHPVAAAALPLALPYVPAGHSPEQKEDPEAASKLPRGQF